MTEIGNSPGTTGAITAEGSPPGRIRGRPDNGSGREAQEAEKDSRLPASGPGQQSSDPIRGLMAKLVRGGHIRPHEHAFGARICA